MEKHICTTCGKAFNYCGHCNGIKHASWKNNYCSENCRDIFKIVMDYVGGYIPINVAKARLLEKDLGINIASNIINTYSNIMTYEKSQPKVVSAPKVADAVIKDEVLKVADAPKQEESKEVEEQPKPRRRRRKRVEKVEE